MLADGAFSRASIAENRNVTLPHCAIIGRLLNSMTIVPGRIKK